MTTGGIYVHIPFCRNKCLYCDFYSGGVRIADWPALIHSLSQELKCRMEEINFFPATLYFGGGTPSLMPPEILLSLVEEFQDILKVRQFEEFTLEANPEDVCEKNVNAWRAAGINRVSLGVQTLNDKELKLLGRRHNSEHAKKALKLLRENFSNIGVDVIFGLPAQTLISYRETLTSLVYYKPDHISAYSLMLEEGTAMTQLVEKNKIILPPEKEWLEMFDSTSEILQKHGYQRYEISNYSLPEKTSRHNSLYWAGNPYIGIGPGAHSYNGDNTRRFNPKDIKGYLKYFRDKINIGTNGEPPFYEEEHLTVAEMREEMIMTRLRCIQGLSLDKLRYKFGNDIKENLLKSAEPFIRRGEMEYFDNFLRFTDKGFLISDSILPYLI